MNQHYTLHVSLFIKAPLISSGGKDAVRGISRMFFRNAEGRLCLQGSHIKGKLKEAVHELLPYMNKWTEDEFNTWFGKDTDEHPTQLERAHLNFSDFILVQSKTMKNEQYQTHVAIDKQTGTSRENFLLTLETLYPSCTMTEWCGEINFFAENKPMANAICATLITGLRWMTGIGGAKSSGYGRLEKVDAELEICRKIQPRMAFDPNQHFYHMIFEFNSELFIGGVVNKTNFRESQKVIPGAVIKGALARCLNELCGAPTNAPINKTNTTVLQHFPHLAEEFNRLHVFHAFPAPPFENVRPVTIPFSVVKDSEDNYFDVALCQKPSLDRTGKAPEFQIDWKDPYAKDDEFGWARCEVINKTRTRIEHKTRTAKEEALYTFQYISPFVKSMNESCDKQPVKVRWIANLTLPPENATEIISEIQNALNNGWCFLGKRNAQFKATLQAGHAKNKIEPHKKLKALAVGDFVVISLQTDALLFDAYEIVNTHTPFDVRKLYQEYWCEATNGSCQMTDTFFARQKFNGGYLARRYKALSNKKYYPFILTAAGSVFVLQVLDADLAHEVLQSLRLNSLPLSNGLISKITQKRVAPENIWQYCPFVPENGYGEININLDWHWKHQFQTKS